MKTAIAVTGSTIGLAVLVILGIVSWSIGRGAAPVARAASAATAPVVMAHAVTPHYTLSIDTPDMLGGSEDTGPAYVPSNLTLPANSDVTITIVNFDDATPLPAGTEHFAVATGIKGSLSIEPLTTADPNGAAPATQATGLDPAKGVSHTFTIAKLGLNVPVAPKSRTTFTFHTGAAGTYEWQCMDPCGTGPAGWNGAMSRPGYMRGSLVLA